MGQAAARGAAHPPLEGAAHQPSSTGGAAGGAAEYGPPGGGGCDDDEVPDDFICPITAELMHDPVLARALTVALPTRLLARRGCTEERRREHLTARLGLSSRRRKGPALLTTAAYQVSTVDGHVYERVAIRQWLLEHAAQSTSSRPGASAHAPSGAPRQHQIELRAASSPSPRPSAGPGPRPAGRHLLVGRPHRP